MDHLGPNFASGTLDVESQMVYFKTLVTSRKNLLEGFARVYAMNEQVFWWTLREQDLEIPASMRREFTWEVSGKKKTIVMDPLKQPLDSIWGCWKAANTLPQVALEYLRDNPPARAKGSKANKKGKRYVRFRQQVTVFRQFVIVC
jgi:hypothetical protein